jgi:hypothetical protein
MTRDRCAKVFAPLADGEREDAFSDRSVCEWTQTSLRTLRPQAISAEAASRKRKMQEAYRNAPRATEDQGGGDLHIMATKKKAKKPAKKAAKKKK